LHMFFLRLNILMPYIILHQILWLHVSNLCEGVSYFPTDDFYYLHANFSFNIYIVTSYLLLPIALAKFNKPLLP
jgi:hypothetical protein